MTSRERLRKALTITLSLILGIAAWSADVRPAAADMIGHGGMVRAVDVSPDGRRVLTASFDYTARLWNFVEQTEIAVLDAHQGPVTNAAFLPDGKRAITTSDDMTAIIWDLAAAKPIRKLTGHKHKVMGIAVARDGKTVATGSWDKAVRIWDVATGKQLRVIENDSPVNTVAFLDGDKSIAAGDHKGRIHIWGVADGRILGTLEGHRMAVTQIAVSPDGKRILSASIDQSMRLWDRAALKEIRKHGEHDGQVYSAQFSPDGKTALTAGRYGYLIQWDLATGEPIRTIKAHDKIIWATRFSPDGRYAITAASDERVRVWHLETGDRIGIGIGELDDEPKPWLTSDHPGAPLFKKCARCHSLSANGHKRSGPHLAGLFGRPAGSVKGYNYSEALTGVDFAWNEKTLFELFDKGPDRYLPGTKMPVQRVTNSEELIQLVDYLKQITNSAN